MTSLADFSALVKGDVITPGHPEYEDSLKRWAASAERKAAVVVFIKDESDAAAAISYARRNSLPIAIRGGGHSPTGASSVEGGLVIDLSRYMNDVTVNPGKKLAYVGGGAIWETVDKKTMEHGLATVAGTVNHVCDSFFDMENCR
jgi:FAD/FMN-containing dehydrogenase